MEIHNVSPTKTPVVNGTPHELEIEYTAPLGGVAELSVYPSSFTVETEKKTRYVELPPSGVRTTHRETVTIRGSIPMVTIIVGTKPYDKEWTGAFKPSP
ncbi:hypothetical protein WME97_45845 [Sorangium sp. So ce367]|uniref:hypothetical protein n=1 Tax=Sorangium sp. So ce367 TaxID=3133305 RepID=UPI003F616E27